VNPIEPEPLDAIVDFDEPAPRSVSFREVPWRLSHAVIGGVPFIAMSVLAMTVRVRGVALGIVLSLALFSYLWMLVYPLIVARRNGWRPQFKIRPAAFAVELVIAACAVFTTWMLIIIGFTIWVALFGESQQPSRNSLTEAALSRNPVLIIAIVVLACVCAPPTEEVFFRGLLYNALRRISPRAVAILIQAVAFGLMHAAGGVMYVVVTGVIGAAFGLVYEFRKTLLTTILCHGIHNTVVAVLVLVALGWSGERPTLGVSVVPHENGVLVTEVTNGGGAETAGIRAGDVLSTVNGYSVRNKLDVLAAIHDKKPGEVIPIEYIRDEQLHHVEVILQGRQSPK
jgi:membrane protease YdiL (CAAX protease family)